jgi:hypothetical protein
MLEKCFEVDTGINTPTQEHKVKKNNATAASPAVLCTVGEATVAWQQTIGQMGLSIGTAWE